MTDDKKNEGYHPADLEESRNNHPHTDERERELTNTPHEGEGHKNSGDSDDRGIQKPAGASPNPEDASDQGGREHGYRTNYGGFSGEAGGKVGDRRSTGDWEPGANRTGEDE